MKETVFVVLFLIFTGFIGFRVKALTASGSVAAIAVGLAVYIGFDFKGLLLLGIFFITSSMWSEYKSSYKKEMEEKLAKGATRDWRQVFANGGTAALLAIIYFYDVNPTWQVAFAVAISSANSDTWASEIGSLSKKKPIYIRTFQRIDKGTSGAISLLGSIAALSGSLLIAFFSFWLFHFNFWESFLVFIFGFAGNVIDTLLGAFYQQKYTCLICGIETEKKAHCNRKTSRKNGISFVDNDIVNFLSGFLAVLLTLVVIHLLK